MENNANKDGTNSQLIKVISQDGNKITDHILNAELKEIKIKKKYKIKNKYSCDLCNTQCRNKRILRDHRRTHTKLKRAIFAKPIIAKFSDLKNLKTDCTVCGLGFPDDPAMKRHMKMHLNRDLSNPKKRYACDHCNLKCDKAYTLRIHINTHTGEKPFSCSACSFVCASPKGLKQHVITHADKKQYNCSYCNYSTNQSRNLNSHERIHTGDKPFSCEHCEYKSARKQSLRVHIAAHAKEPLSFSCEFCSFSSRYSDNLSRHTRKLHSNNTGVEKPRERPGWTCLSGTTPSSAALERLFSIGSDILRPTRSSLTADNFEKLVFIKGNLHLLRGKKWLPQMEKEEEDNV